MRLKLNKNRLILLLVVSIILLGFATYYYLKFQEEIKTYGLYVLIVIMVFMFFFAMHQPRRKRTPGEIEAYRDERARLQAQKDHYNEEKRREEERRVYNGWINDFFGFSKRKK